MLKKLQALAAALLLTCCLTHADAQLVSGGSGGGGGTTYTAGAGICITGTTIAGCIPDNPKSANYTVGADGVTHNFNMGELLTLSGSGSTLTITAITTTIFANSQYLCYTNNGPGIWTISSGVTINNFPDAALRIFIGGSGCLVSNGVSIDWQPGVKGAGGTFTGLYLAGATYQPFGIGALAVGAANTTTTYYGFNGAILDTVTITNLCAKVTTAQALSNVQIAIYQVAGGRPTTLVDHTASIATIGTGVKCGAPSLGNLTLPPGLYAFIMEEDTAGLVFDSISTVQANMAQLQGANTATNAFATSANLAGYDSATAVYGTWPSLTGTTWTELVAATVAGIGFQL